MITRLISAGLMFMLCVSILHAQEFDRRGRRDREGRGFDGVDGSEFRRGRERGGFDRRRGDRDGAGWGRFDPISRLDSNQNGVIDQTEIDGIPERFRVMMNARGLDIQGGDSVDDVRSRLRQAFGEGRREWQRRGREERRGDGDSGRANRSTPPPPFKPRDRKRITVDLSTAYVEADSDLDGQIGLYEWIVARREDLELFDEIDGNADGLLTPRELVAWDNLKANSGKALFTVSKRERLVIVGTAAGSSPGAKSESNDLSKSKTSRDRERIRGRADWIFGRMDGDRDGTISLDEWNSSRRMRPWFERAGVRIRPMSQSEFSEIYMRLSTATGGQANGR